MASFGICPKCLQHKRLHARGLCPVCYDRIQSTKYRKMRRLKNIVNGRMKWVIQESVDFVEKSLCLLLLKKLVVQRSVIES